VVAGELHLTLEVVAECYRVEARMLHEVYELGLLGRGAVAEDSIAIHVSRLDRVAEVVRLHRYLGVDLSGILLLLGPLDD
jgi:hypothetical protein